MSKNACSPAKTDPAERDLAFSLPPSDPPRKTIHNLPKTSPPQDLHGPRGGFVPGTNKRPRVYVVKNTYLKYPCHCTGNDQNISHTKHNPTCTHTMDQDYPFTLPSPGDNPTIYPSFPALTWRGLSEDRIPKIHLFFHLDFSWEENTVRWWWNWSQSCCGNWTPESAKKRPVSRWSWRTSNSRHKGDIVRRMVIIVSEIFSNFVNESLIKWPIYIVRVM